jgi:formamidopyrimidine-DNA glycosylase
VPELPEIETLKRGIEPLVLNHIIQKINIYNHQLRWLVPKNISQSVQHQVIRSVQRRGKYLLLITDVDALVIHLGMSGSLQLLPYPHVLKKHDHVDIILDNGKCLCFNDPRRFGVLLLRNTPLAQKLLDNLGIEPLSSEFTGKYLYEQSRKKKGAVKIFIMNSHIVTGIGNIYATEALFLAGIDPRRAVNKITLQECELLVSSIKKILVAAINNKGTTFRNFITHNGSSGEFKAFLKTYGRAGLPCVRCKHKLELIRIGQRSTVYCPFCQK